MKNMKKFLFILCAALFAAAVSCEKNLSITAITGEAKSITCAQEEISGQVILPEGKTIDTQFGVLYSTSDVISYGSAQDVVAKEYDSDYKFRLEIAGLQPTTTYYYRTYIYRKGDIIYGEVKNFTTLALPGGPVDLGLSVKWASCNIGASRPEEYGKYFAWGDVTGQTLDGKKWSGGGFSTYPEYELDAKNNLKPEYDAAHVILGGSWRMPTKAECQELIDNCTSTLTTINGVNGRLFTGKKPGYTDKSIFLPGAGYGSSYTRGDAGSVGYYWSSTFNVANHAWGLFSYPGHVDTGTNYRSYGQSVRPVSE